jgi:hypothetical protein
LFSKWKHYSVLIKQINYVQMFIISNCIYNFHLTLLTWLHHAG